MGWKKAAWGAKVASSEVSMNSGSLYELEIKYFRRTSQTFTINSRSYLHIKWSSDKLKI